MFSEVEARFALRCVLFGLSAFLVALQANGSPVTWSAVWSSAIAAGVAALAYGGIGYASSSVEPSIGNKRTPDS
jgi:hypothetical protein